MLCQKFRERNTIFEMVVETRWCVEVGMQVKKEIHEMTWLELLQFGRTRERQADMFAELGQANNLFLGISNSRRVVSKNLTMLEEEACCQKLAERQESNDNHVKKHCHKAKRKLSPEKC